MNAETQSGNLTDGTPEQPTVSPSCGSTPKTEEEIVTETVNDILEMLQTCMKIELHKFKSSKIRNDRRAYLARASSLQEFHALLVQVRDGEDPEAAK